MSLHNFSVAPMMRWTDSMCRRFHRLLTRHALLYTEMVVADALIHGQQTRLLDFDAFEKPLALQLGGRDPDTLAKAAHLGAAWGYDEINLNAGCPSDRVGSGAFGACLMKEPRHTAACFSAMQEASSVPVSIKCRLGVDNQIPEESLFRFVEALMQAGCKTFIIHARKAWLKGLSPKENRDIPPLDYDLVHRVKKEWPSLNIILNGGLENPRHAFKEKKGLDGAMLGRSAYHNSFALVEVDPLFFGSPAPVSSREEVVEHLIRLFEKNSHLSASVMARHILGLYHGVQGGRAWRYVLSTQRLKEDKGYDLFIYALNALHEIQNRGKKAS